LLTSTANIGLRNYPIQKRLKANQNSLEEETRMIKRKITQEQFDHLASDLHKFAAQVLISRGEWKVVEHQTSGDCRVVRL
jgi:hypothetical protein